MSGEKVTKIFLAFDFVMIAQKGSHIKFARVLSAIKRAWGYNFDALSELADNWLINGSKRSKSIIFTPEGEKLADDLLKKYKSI